MRIIFALGALTAVLLNTPSVAQAPIDEGVYKHYTRKGHPKAFAILGELVVLGPIQRLRKEAATYAASQPGCGKVMWSELSQDETTSTKWVVYADCQNGMRYYVDWDGRKWSKKNPPWN